MPSSDEPALNDYSVVAGDYAARFSGELDHKPFDRDLLDQFAERVRGKGPVCDLGCGPGHIAAYLAARGADAFGVDLSPAMAAAAHKLNPNLHFETADMRALPAEDNTWAGIAAFYSIIHIPREQVTAALREMRRALQPDGLLLLAFHIGIDVLHIDEWWEKPVNLDFYFFTSAELEIYLEQADFEVERNLTRPPYVEVEHPSRRGYILARKPR